MIQLIRGFKDILPGEVEVWHHIEKTASRLFSDFGYREIRIPVMERTELFARSIGENTDIVEKEMYTFADRKGDSLTLRPEATASIVRSYIQHKMFAQDPVHKLFFIGPMFRRERPQKGRYRQFYQIDAEVFGSASPYTDVQLIVMLTELLDRLTIRDIEVHINSLGCPECRPGFKTALSAFLNSVDSHLCSDCRRRKDKNPLRVLDCKVPTCQTAIGEAPTITDSLCGECRQHFKTVRRALDDHGTTFKIDKHLVRGLDYYTRTIFEIQTGALGAQNAIVGGGRYDGLVQALGGPDIPATGFAIGFDRLVEISNLNRADYIRKPDIFIAALGATAQAMAFEWACMLSSVGILAEMDLEDRSLKSQMKRADRLGTDYVLILGDTEIKEGSAVLRNMTSKVQTPLPLDDIIPSVRKRIES